MAGDESHLPQVGDRTIEIDRHREYVSRVGLRLFAVYCLGYFAFMLTAVLSLQSLAATWIWGLNGAIITGMLLIFGAIVMSVIYLVLCNRDSVAFHGRASEGEGR